METRKTARNLKDDGSFDCLKEKAKALANGDPNKALNLLTEMVVHDFLACFSKQKTPVDLLAFKIPKKQRGSCGYPSAEEIMASSMLLSLKEPGSSLMDKKMKRELIVDHKEEELMEDKVDKIYNVKLEKPNKGKGKKRLRVAKNDDDDHEEKKKKKNKKPSFQVPENLVIPPGLPVHLLNRIQDMGSCSVPQFLIQKCVYPSDVNPELRRFSMPLRVIKHTSLMKEAEILKDKTFAVTLIDSSNMNEYPTNFKKWTMSSNFVYNLVHNWPLILNNIVMKIGDWVQLWWFRRNSKICLLFVNLQDGKGDVASSSNTGCGEAGSSSGGNATDQSGVTEEEQH